MMKVLEHFYQYAEVYTVLFAAVVIPLGYFACYLFFSQHYGMFETHGQDK